MCGIISLIQIKIKLRGLSYFCGVLHETLPLTLQLCSYLYLFTYEGPGTQVKN